MKKEYPFEWKYLENLDGGGTWGYYSKGHHPPQMLADAVAVEEDMDIDCAKVEHKWMRWGIVAGDEIGAGSHAWARSLMDSKQGKRGAFPVTIIEL